MEIQPTRNGKTSERQIDDNTKQRFDLLDCENVSNPMICRTENRKQTRGCQSRTKQKSNTNRPVHHDGQAGAAAGAGVVAVERRGMHGRRKHE